MFISIIIPVFNREKYIRRCLNSILRQSFKDYELIIVDDGSYDATGKICDEYAKKYNKIRVIHQVNAGVSRARNVGLKNMRGKFVTFIDSDDFIPSNYLEQIRIAYEKYGDGFLYCTSFKIYSETGIQFFRYRENSMYSVLNASGLFSMINKGLFNSVVNKIYESSRIKNYHIFFPEKLDLGEDMVFNLRYLDSVDKFEFVMMNKNYYLGWAREKKGSLERSWREDFYKIQRRILQEKVTYLHKWIKEGKVRKKDEINICVWNMNCIRESVDYYSSNINNMHIREFWRKIDEIRRSQEYLNYLESFGKEAEKLSEMLFFAFVRMGKERLKCLFTRCFKNKIERGKNG